MGFEVGRGRFDPGFQTGEVFGKVFLEFPTKMKGQKDKSGDGADDGGEGKGQGNGKRHAAVEPTQDGVAEDSEEEGYGDRYEEARGSVQSCDNNDDGGKFDEEANVIFG